MQTKERLERIKSIIQDEKGFVEEQLNHYSDKTYEKGFYEGKLILSKELLRLIDVELEEVKDD